MKEKLLKWKSSPFGPAIRTALVCGLNITVK